jgi:ADP-ribose pyrophosphatase YjhB (NUDIX family)
MKQVAKITLSDDDNHILMGMRNDNGKWTESGGHMEEGELPSDAILRELEEESGIRLNEDDLTYHGAKSVKDDLVVHSFSAKLPRGAKPTPVNDPDKEVAGWALIHAPGKKIPKVIHENLHVPAKHNVQHFFLGFEKGASVLRKLRPSRQLRKFIEELPSQYAQSKTGND